MATSREVGVTSREINGEIEYNLCRGRGTYAIVSEDEGEVKRRIVRARMHGGKVQVKVLAPTSYWADFIVTVE
jgi:hypothetical protein